MHWRRKEVIKAILKRAVMNWELDLAILNSKKRRVKLKENIIVKGKLTNREEILAYMRNMKKLFEEKLSTR
jgi:hypothetical protein